MLIIFAILAVASGSDQCKIQQGEISTLLNEPGNTLHLGNVHLYNNLAPHLLGAGLALMSAQDTTCLVDVCIIFFKLQKRLIKELLVDKDSWEPTAENARESSNLSGTLDSSHASAELAPEIRRGVTNNKHIHLLHDLLAELSGKLIEAKDLCDESVMSLASNVGIVLRRPVMCNDAKRTFRKVSTSEGITDEMRKEVADLGGTFKGDKWYPTSEAFFECKLALCQMFYFTAAASASKPFDAQIEKTSQSVSTVVRKLKDEGICDVKSGEFSTVSNLFNRLEKVKNV